MKDKYFTIQLFVILLFLTSSWNSFSQNSTIQLMDFSVINKPTYNAENVQENRILVSFKVSDVKNVNTVKLVFLDDNNIIQSEIIGTYNINENGYFFNYDGKNAKVSQFETIFEVTDIKLITPQTKKVKLFINDKLGLTSNSLEFTLLP